MLEQSWEAYATSLANCETTQDLISTYESLAAQLRIDVNSPATVVYAYDTRPSGPELIAAFEAGLGAFGDRVKKINLGITTTPVLHYVVKASNDKSGAYGKPTIEGYYEKLAAAFKILVGNRAPLPPLYVDCANGVGAIALEEFGKYVADEFPLKALNNDLKTKGALNYQCGADFVKTRQQLPPSIAEAGILAKPDTRGASFDGDADRLVYYYLRDGKTFRLLDGDKIAVLAALFIEDLVKRAKLAEEIKVGVVQTAYANGSSTKFIKEVSHEPQSVLTTSVTFPSLARLPVSSTSTTLRSSTTLVSTSRPTATAPFCSRLAPSRPSTTLSPTRPTSRRRSRTSSRSLSSSTRPSVTHSLTSSSSRLSLPTARGERPSGTPATRTSPTVSSRSRSPTAPSTSPPTRSASSPPLLASSR